MTETKDRFVYVTYIRTTQAKLWDALRNPVFTRQYWFGVALESDWQVGSGWKMQFPDGRVTDMGEVLEIDPPRKLVLSWRHAMRPELRDEGEARATMELQPIGEVVKLTVTHEIDRPQSKLIRAVAGGWPQILSSLKSFLETGTPLPRTSEPPR
jgi:uncharacterized protein YndB with AHSA1/START domain